MYYATPFHVFRRAAFDQWAFTPGEGLLSTPYNKQYNKQLLITGHSRGGTDIRPTIAEDQG